MDLLEDPVFKRKYQKNKLRVKLWESDFMEKYGRKPNKNDIKYADTSIKEAYKVYWKLKTRALEETLTDITFYDDVQGNVSNQSPRKITNDQKQDKNPTPEKITRDTENIYPHNVECIKTDDSSDQLLATNVEGTWGDHLNKSKEQVSNKRQTLLISKSTSFQLSRNKFENSTFTKRNPRKSLSSYKLKINSEKNDVSNSSLEWRDLQSKQGVSEIEETKFMFGEPLKVTFEGNKSFPQSVNTIQQLVDGRINNVSRNIDQGWLNRCRTDDKVEISHSSSQQRFSGISDSGIESIESSIYSPQNLEPVAVSGTSLQFSDEEDFICNSDSEEERRNKRVRNFKKRLSSQDGRVAKRPCIDPEVIIENSVDRVMPSDKIDIDKLTPDIDASFDLTNTYSKLDIDDIKQFKLTCDINPDFNSVNDSLKIQTDKISLNTDIELKAVDKDKKLSNNVSQDKNEQIYIESGSVTDISTLDDFPNQKESSVPDKKLVKSRKPRKRQQKISSDDLDPNFTEKDKRNTKTSETRSIKMSLRQRNKMKSPSGNDNSNVKRKHSYLKKDNEEQNSDSEMKITLYNVESLQTVPRFAIKPSGTTDLIVQCSEAISIDKSEKDTSVPVGKITQLTNKDKLEKKIATGTLNNNFVRINLKKKVFVRGKKNFNLSKYKKNQWKQRKKELSSSESNMNQADLIDKTGMTCFKCGKAGHFAKNCSTSKGDDLLPLDVVDLETSRFPTLEEAEKMANQNAVVAHSHKIERLPARVTHSSTSLYSQNKEGEEEDLAQLFNDDFDENKDVSIFRHKIPQEIVSKLFPPQVETINPLYSSHKDGNLIQTPVEVLEALRMFGHEYFRPGQEKAIMRILSGQSTLVTMSTGSGKSLCYQLPAYLYSQRYHCITLIVSPLVSLMDDQVTGVPSFLSAACLHTNQSPKIREQVMERVKDGKINILLVSPEAIVSSEKSTGFGSLLRQLPPIAFACIDEAHCISQWSHNFRPSYLMVCRILKEKLHVKTILGLTATATKATVTDIIKYLVLPDGMNGVISDVPVPKNLLLTVSNDENKDQALIALLKSERFQECDSIIVYCTRRDECVRIAGLLRISLQDTCNSKSSNMKISNIAEAYHAGMTAYRRKIVQKKFMNGEIKIVVATVAFGMGINKPDIRSVIHYNMPGTFEGYVQEIGRAGRDGLTAHCHLFLNFTQNSDKWELRRHIHANGIDRHTIRHLLQRIFIRCSCANMNKNKSDRRCLGHEVALPIDETVQVLDITEETISTLLCYLELHPKRFITVLPSVYIRARVSSYDGPQGLKRAAQSSPPLAMAIALDMQKGISHEDSNIIEFPIIDVASAIGWDSGIVKSHLKNLEWTTGADGKIKRSVISVHFDKLGLRVKAPGDLTDTELDDALDTLIARTQSQELSCLQQLEIISSALNKINVASIKNCLILNDEVTKRSEELKLIIREYFQSDSPLNRVDINLQDTVTNESQIASDVRSLITCYRDTTFTGRTVARIFNGIQSPNYPAVIWSKCRFWRAHLASDFNTIYKIATKEILALR